MAQSPRYQDQLSTLSQGLALWNPNPPKEIYDKVSIGDVGYLLEGSFIRMFNVMLRWNHESNRTLGEPEPYESLDCGPFANTLKRQFDSVKHCSRYVSAETNAGNGQAMTPDDVECVTYKFWNCGAVLSLPNGGQHEDVIRAQVFEDYIQAHVASWFTWARKNRLGVERVEDLILVSGCTLVTSWAAAAFVDDNMDAEISLASRTLNNGGTRFVWSNIRGCVLYHNSRSEPFHGEQNSTMTQDQCVFIRGFRVNHDKNHKMQVIRVSCNPEYDDPNSGVVDTIRPSIKNENPQHPTLQTNDGLFDASYTMGSSSSLDIIGPPINRENLQLLPYPSSTTIQSNGDICNLSFMTSPSFDSLMEVPNDIAIIDQATTADMRAVRRQQIKNKILAVGRMQLMFQNLREQSENAPGFNVASIGMDDPRSFGARNEAEHENPQPLTYPSSTTLQSSGDQCAASSMTSLSDNSIIEAPNDIADRATIDEATTANMRAARRQQIKDKIQAIGRMQLMFQNLREQSENAPGFNVASVGTDDPRSFGARDGMDALGVPDNQIRRYTHSFDDARRLAIANERLPEFNPMAFPGPQVPVPSMQRTQRPWGSGNTIPTSEGDVSRDLSKGAVAGLLDVPGGWPVVQPEDLRRRSRVGGRWHK